MAKCEIAPPAEAAKKFLALAQRSRDHLTEVYELGRWKHYYSERNLVVQARKLNQLCDDWSRAVALCSKEFPALRRAAGELASPRISDRQSSDELTNAIRECIEQLFQTSQPDKRTPDAARGSWQDLIQLDLQIDKTREMIGQFDEMLRNISSSPPECGARSRFVNLSCGAPIG